MTTSATIYTSSASGWTNSGNVYSDNGTFAEAALTGGGTNYGATPFLVCTGFTNLASGIGAGDYITSLVLGVKHKKSSGSTTVTGRWNCQVSGQTITEQMSPSLTTTSTAITSTFDDVGAGDITAADLSTLSLSIWYDTVNIPYPDAFVDYVWAYVTYEDHTPAAFTFTDITGAAVSTEYISDSIVVSGVAGQIGAWIDDAAITNYSAGFSINGGAWTSDQPNAVNSGDSVRVKLTTTAAFSTAHSVTLTLGNIPDGYPAGTTDTYTVTTLAADTTPDAFSWPPVTGVETGTLTTSSSVVTVSGINSAATITINSDGSARYRKNFGSWVFTSGTVVNGDTVGVRKISDSAFSTLTTATVTIGGVVGTFDITTRAGDTTPNAFTFTDVSGAGATTTYSSNLITITGIDASTNVSFSSSGGTVHEYRKNGGAWTAIGATTVVNNDTLEVRLTTGAAGTVANITMTVGGVVDTYTVATVDITPAQFNFTDVTGAIPGVVYTSNQEVLSGMTPATPVTANVTGGEMRIDAGSWVTSGDVINGSGVTVRVTASLVPGGVATSLLSIDATSDTYSVTTRAGVAPADF